MSEAMTTDTPEKDTAKFDACVDWFFANRDALLPKYHGKYVVCADGKALGAWGNFALATFYYRSRRFFDRLRQIVFQGAKLSSSKVSKI